MRYSIVQIQAIVEVARCGFHVSKAARRLNTSQSVVSKHLKSFEDIFAAKVFTRSGKRLTGLTQEGEKIMQHAERIISDHNSIEKIGQEAGAFERESLSLVTTPTLARYLLAPTVKKFRQMHRQVQLHIQVEETDKAVESLRHGMCDLAIVPIGKLPTADFTMTPLTQWPRSLIGLPDCPLFDGRDLTLETIATEPIIAFETPTISLQDTFDKYGIATNAALTTSNPDVMKAYAELGLGVAVVATPTFDAQRDAPLVGRDVSDIFPPVRIAALQTRGSYHIALQSKFLEYLKAGLT
ncbi:LysR substrate-binding domain-containing protein [Albirhodobacter sp. R86504]|jgi:DNA-binding transcriptional LysR family regulator|uniref:LysR substrate-binding domain-containing protein n=1 Tax=Albirhodobacter sp. R86504 TaxID=3093848 RepID=UPI003670E494